MSGESDAAGVALLRDVRFASHEGFDRIVFDFGADSIPSYEVRSLDGPAIQCGSGRPIEPDSDRSIQISFRMASAHTEAGEATVHVREQRPRLPSLSSLRLICDFEGHVDWLVGLDATPRLRVLELRNPHRWVIDLAHP